MVWEVYVSIVLVIKVHLEAQSWRADCPHRTGLIKFGGRLEIKGSAI
jgi:hypothetical protein